MISWWSRRNDLACSEVVALVTEYLEGSLPRGVRRRVERHLANCLNCSEYLEQIRAIVRAAGRPDLAAHGDVVTGEDRTQLIARFHTLRGE